MATPKISALPRKIPQETTIQRLDREELLINQIHLLRTMNDKLSEMVELLKDISQGLA